MKGLDALAHARVCGLVAGEPCANHEIDEAAQGYWQCLACGEHGEWSNTEHTKRVPRYSESIADAWELVEALQERGIQSLRIEWSRVAGRWECSLFYRESDDTFVSSGVACNKTAPLAITELALHVCGVPESEIEEAMRDA